MKLDRQGEQDKAEGSTLGRMSLDKKYHGDLEGSAKGTMLTAGTDVKGSAGYVAIERVTGTLNGNISGDWAVMTDGTGTASVNLTYGGNFTGTNGGIDCERSGQDDGCRISEGGGAESVPSDAAVGGRRDQRQG